MTLETVLRDLYASEMNGEVCWNHRGWSARIGCPERGWVAKTESHDLAGIADWLVQRTLIDYPTSDFAEKYRPPPEEEKPGVAVKRSRRGG